MQEAGRHQKCQEVGKEQKRETPSTEKVNYYCLHEKIIVGVVVIEFLSQPQQ